jgi:hypothetical protein
MDIKAAFDTIKQDKMIEIISNLLDQVHPFTRGLVELIGRTTITA